MLSKIYVLITSAKNEEAYIEKTIKSVVSQTILPKKWVIVSDGSTDCTDEVVKKYENKYDFIELIRLDNDRERDFASKVCAINAGYKQLRNVGYDFIGNLDADVTFCKNYYESMMEKFEQNDRLGIVGGIILELHNQKFVQQKISLDSVAGAVQFFRRKCFEECGGYKPLKLGGEDALVENIAKMKKWEVRTLSEIEVLHHRLVGKGKDKIFKSSFNEGKMFYMLGYHPIFFLFRFLYRLKDKPYFFKVFFQVSGYFWSTIRRENRPVPDYFIKYLRHEQMKKLKAIFLTFGFPKTIKIPNKT